MKNILLSILAVILLFGFALAIPSGNVSEELSEQYETETDDGGEFGFL